jgi:hypothetical protein
LSGNTITTGTIDNTPIGNTTQNTGLFTSVGANGDVTASSNRGAFYYGSLGYTDVNHILTMQSSQNSYTQMEIQNTNSGSAASADVVVGNDLTTSTTYYGDFGINSSSFTGTSVFSKPSYVYLTATSGDLALGTTTSNAIHFVVNSATSDAATISSTGLFTANNFSSSSVNITGGTITNVVVTPSTLSGGTISNATIINSTLTGSVTASAATLVGTLSSSTATLTGLFTGTNATLSNVVVASSTLTNPTLNGAITASAATLVGLFTGSNATLTSMNITSSTLNSTTIGSTSAAFGAFTAIEQPNTLSTNYTITANSNGHWTTPVSISAIVTINSTSSWTLI